MATPRLRRAALTLLGAGLLPAVGCGPAPEAASAQAASSTAPSLTRVATVRPERATIRRTTAQPGQVEAVEVAAIHAKLAGYVRTVSVDIGDAVKRGQVLAVLHVPEVEADLKQKRAMVDKAEAEKKQSESAVEVAKAGIASGEAKVAEAKAGDRRAEADTARWASELARVEQLARERALTGSLLDETRSKATAAEAGRDEVRAKVRSAEAASAEARALADKAKSDVVAAVAHVEVARAEADRAGALAGYAEVVAPFDGVVTRRAVDTGTLTTPGATEEPLFVVVRSDRVTVTVGVPETEAPFVNAGDPATIRLQALDGRAIEGKVARTAWALDPATRTLRVEVDLPNPDGSVRPGLYAYATIIAEEHRDVLTLPTTAVVKEGAKSYCMVAVDGMARRKELAIGLGDGKRTEVVSGLTGGEDVVATNAASLADGQPVERQPPDPGAAKPKS